MKDPGWSSLKPVSQRKRKNTSFGVNTNTCKMKQKSSAFICRRKERYLDSISASPTCIERDGNKAEAQKGKYCSKIKSISAKVIQIDDSSSSEIATNSLPLGSLPDAEAVSVAGPSGIHTQSRRTGNEKCFLCDFCEKDLDNKHNLNAHHRTHTGEKPFACSTCGKRFNKRGNLTTHFRTHTGEKPFACHGCSKGFAQRNHLACHLRTHTGEKPYKCKLFGMPFADERNCNAYYKRKHGGK
ncbi:Zinc finger protein 214 [Araneus ventricosus]|uniref:Protein krueppel n=1 Tax=Araneus ventricosus TaxID=182803 RepID=A0A4Y2KWW5_ARAVE|nr:Zinc finger protein 214 [Araneus ventricosus]